MEWISPHLITCEPEQIDIASPLLLRNFERQTGRQLRAPVLLQTTCEVHCRTMLVTR